MKKEKRFIIPLNKKRDKRGRRRRLRRRRRRVRVDDDGATKMKEKLALWLQSTKKNIRDFLALNRRVIAAIAAHDTPYTAAAAAAAAIFNL